MPAPQKKLCWGELTCFPLASAFLVMLVSPVSAAHSRRPRLGWQNCAHPIRNCSCHRQAPQHIPPHPQLVLGGTVGLYLCLESWFAALSSSVLLNGCSTGCATSSCQKQRGMRCSGLWHRGAWGGQTLLVAQTQGGWSQVPPRVQMGGSLIHCHTQTVDPNLWVRLARCRTCRRSRCRHCPLLHHDSLHPPDEAGGPVSDLQRQQSRHQLQAARGGGEGPRITSHPPNPASA